MIFTFAKNSLVLRIHFAKQPLIRGDVVALIQSWVVRPNLCMSWIVLLLWLPE